jgi:hypothetical protein
VVAMKFVLAVPLLLFLFYMITFAVHNWKARNKLAAAGIVIIALSAVALPFIYLFSQG